MFIIVARKTKGTVEVFCILQLTYENALSTIARLMLSCFVTFVLC
jgi:hypothetical protein